MNKGWKYGLIKVAIEDEGTDYEEQINLLVELYPLGENGEYDAYCKARIQSLEELQNAQADIERDGINEWFYDNGTFTWDKCKDCYNGKWDWEPYEDENQQDDNYDYECDDVRHYYGGCGCEPCQCE